jgi:hypothetical protein
MNAQLNNCKIHVRSGEFFLGGNRIERCQFIFHDSAENVRNLSVGYCEAIESFFNPLDDDWVQAKTTQTTSKI